MERNRKTNRKYKRSSYFSLGFDVEKVTARRSRAVRLQGGRSFKEQKDQNGVHPDPGARRTLRQVVSLISRVHKNQIPIAWLNLGLC